MTKKKEQAPWGDGCVENEDGTRSPMALGGTQPQPKEEDKDREKEDPERWDGMS